MSDDRTLQNGERAQSSLLTFRDYNRFFKPRFDFEIEQLKDSAALRFSPDTERSIAKVGDSSICTDAYAFIAVLRHHATHQECEFTKNKNDTALRVVYQGTLYLGHCNMCCKRWFITFNGAECSGPLPIDVALWIRNKDEDNHRPGAIEGYCGNISKGKIRVGINIGNCAGFGNADGSTGFKSVSRLVIEEVTRSQ